MAESFFSRYSRPITVKVRLYHFIGAVRIGIGTADNYKNEEMGRGRL